jgi:hypothetical protein
VAGGATFMPFRDLSCGRKLPWRYWRESRSELADIFMETIQPLCQRPASKNEPDTARLIGALSDADRLFGRLAGEGDRLPNPHILIRHFVQREGLPVIQERCFAFNLIRQAL